MALGHDRSDAGSPIRDPDADGLQSIKDRIREYKDAGLETDSLEEQQTNLTNRLKGRRKMDSTDRDDSTDGAAEMKKAEKERRSERSESDNGEDPATEAVSSAITDGVINPDDAPGASSSVPDQVGEPTERVDGPQKTSSVPDQGPKRTDAAKSSAASKPASESVNKPPSAAATKVTNKDKK